MSIKNYLFPNGKIVAAVLIIKITAIFWLIMKLMSWNVWLGERAFPLLPVIEWTQTPGMHLFLIYASLLVLIVILFLPVYKCLLLLLVVLEIASLSLDYMRWQPWEYQFLLTFFIFVIIKDRKFFLFALMLLVAGIYFFSGIHKINGGFLHSIWKVMILKGFFHVPNEWLSFKWLHYSGFVIAVAEALMGITLVFLRNKKIVLTAIILFHLFLLLVLGPLGVTHNNIVLPWNLLMIMYAVVFWFYPGLLVFQWGFFKEKIAGLFLLFVILLPGLHFFNLWDGYLSFKFYAGNTKQAVVCMDSFNEATGLSDYRAKNKNFFPCENAEDKMIYVNNWALKELNVPVYPETRVFKIFKEELEAKYPNTRISVFEYTYPRTAEKVYEID